MKFFIPDIFFDLNKQVFENLRNTIACITIAVAGRVILQFPQFSPFPAEISSFCALAVIAVAAVFCAINIVLGLLVILEHGRNRNAGPRVALVLLALCHGFISIVLLKGVFFIQLSALKNL
ncbi:MAG: hypothetical protein E7H60_17935 [Pseudomonas oryzihabitans]|uniref:hypothetical protein n=1 Tax=Pseudomonas oryzihabitans TaxID=47885 RepID=UPI002914D0AB|nr:hypothetical protein [Pseudomonas oryzihabitans]MDU4058424.1 hypothetical protein [Pseudomonas oryzihabitans]